MNYNIVIERFMRAIYFLRPKMTVPALLKMSESIKFDIVIMHACSIAPAQQKTDYKRKQAKVWEED